MPKHLAITMQDLINVKDVPLQEIYKKRNLILMDIIREQVRQNIPMISFFVLASEIKNAEHFTSQMDSLIELCNSLSQSDLMHSNKIRATVFGKWYDLPSRIIEPIKSLVEATRDYDCFFINLCVNYDGQDEIVDACRIIARKVLAGKLDPESIERETIKENIYSSYFLAPDLIIKNGSEKLAGFLLWDSTNSKIYFTNKHWYHFTNQDLAKALLIYGKK